MENYLFLSLVSFAVSIVLSIPFIGLLYRIKFRSPAYGGGSKRGKSSVFNQLLGHKVGTPTGAGILTVSIVILLSLLYAVLTSHVDTSLLIVILAAVLFGILGLIDDWQKFFDKSKTGLFGLRMRHKFILQLIISAVIAVLLYVDGYHTLNITFIGTLDLGALYPVYATLLITFVTNAYNIADGLDGLSGGLLFIELIPLWIIGAQSVTILTVTAVLTGTILGFLYFNVNPARFFMGDTGSMGLGAILSVLILLSRQDVAMSVVILLIVLIAVSSLIQMASMKFRHGKKVFLIAPVHHHYRAKGWNETKVVERFWIIACVCAIAGLAIYLVS